MAGVVAGAGDRVGRHPAIAGFEAEDAAEMAGHADGAGAVAALMQRAVAGGGGHPCPGRGRTGVVAVLPGVMGDAGERAAGNAGPAEFRGGGFAEDDRAFRPQPGDEGGIEAAGDAGVDVAAGFPRHILHGSEVFDGDGDAVQAAERATGHEGFFRRAGGVHRLIGGQGGEGVQARFQPFNAAEEGLGDLHRGEGFRAQHRRQFGRR